MTLFAISYSTIKEIGRWGQLGLDMVLVNEVALCNTLRRQTLLTAEDLPRDFKMIEETVFPQFRESKYGIFDWAFQYVNDTLLENVVRNPSKF